MDEFLRIALPVYFAAFFAAAFFWRTYKVWKQTGVNPYVIGGSETAYGSIGVGFKLSLLLNLIAIVSFSFYPEAYEYLGRLKWLELTGLRTAGLVLLFASLVFIWLAQTRMGESWRVGIDKEHETELVTTGFFGFTRNPIFLGMRTTGLGLFLAIPNALTFATLVLGDVLIQVQVRLEEEFLLKQHGQKYKEYKERVRRWI